MTEPTREELKPCPFCGGKAWMLVKPSGRYSDATIGCSGDCIAAEGNTYTSEKYSDPDGEQARRLAIDAWNTRALTRAGGKGEDNAVRDVLTFYANEWRGNMEGDGETPGLSRCWQEPTDALLADEGQKAREALAALAGGSE